MKKALIFDCDGTLLDTLEDLANSVNYALGKHGYPLRNLEEIRTFLGNGVRLLITRALPEGEKSIDPVLDTFQEHYMLHSRDITRPYDGIVELLVNLKNQGFKLAIVSNKFDTAVKDLSKEYFGDIFDISLGEDEANGRKKKPAPDMVFEALNQLGCSPEDAIYIGDSDVDYATSAAAGVDHLMVLWGFRDKETLKKAGALNFVSAPDEILSYLSCLDD